MFVGFGYMFWTCFTYPIFWLLLALVLILHHVCKNPGCLPPRPKGWPVVGNALAVPSNVPLYRWCMEQTKTYGPVIRVTMGLKDAVILNDRESIQEALVGKSWQFSGRPVNAAFESISGNFSNVSFTDPDQATWKLRRKMLVTSLRNFTTGDAYESRVVESLSKLTEIFDRMAESEEAFDPEHSLTLFVHDYMAAMCYGKSFEFGDRMFQQLHDANQEFAVAMGRVYSTDVIPALKWLPFDMPDIARLKRMMAEPINGFIQTNFQDHLDNPSENPTDLTYHLLNLKAESGDPLMRDVTDTNVQEIASEIFNAGTDTSRGTLLWLFLCLSRRPDVQTKVYEEIVEVLGKDRQKLEGRSVFSARSRMVYAEAVLMECMRFGTVAPMGLPRKTLEDSRIGRFDIRAGTQIFINQYAVNHDSADFEDAYHFNPERFLSGDGSLERSPQLSFGLGRRACPGEQSAKSTIWLILTTLVERYRFLAGDDARLSDDMYVNSLFDGSPKTFLIIVEKRRIVE